MDEESPQGQTSNFGELNSENDKRIRERVRYNNLSPLAKQHRISKIAEARVNRNRNTIHEGEGLHETGQTCVTQTCNVPVTRARNNEQYNRVHILTMVYGSQTIRIKPTKKKIWTAWSLMRYSRKFVKMMMQALLENRPKFVSKGTSCCCNRY
ncbi:hypothetical protein PVAP13_9KG146370 [Panicum virgatum]|uniref:Uncharacterized protein n=1 Tax=Panicum virgatum TaxID=38727 RepID=A0A8T0NFP5_PANVG|nr:hypothetical protein PVAP13_9KG146370 [Panicum virgatum]